MDSHETTEHFSLRWNNYHNNLSTGFHSLLQAEDLVDVTLAAEGNFIQAHKIVLSICSPYFKALFKMNPCQHPIVILKDVSMKELTAILEFMYKGEVSVNQEDLTLFLKTAEMLQIKGLTGDDNTEEKNDVCHPTTPPKRTKLVNKPNKSIGSQRKTPKLDIVDTVKVSEKNQNNESSTKRIEEPVAISPNENIISNNCELTNRLHGPVLESTKIEPIDFDEDDDPMDDDLDDFDDSNMHSYSKTGLNLDESSVSQSYSLAKSASDIFLLSEQPSESTSNSLPASFMGGDEKGEGNHGRGVICPFCQKRFSTKGNLTVHVRDRHTKSEIHFVCPLCSKKSKNQGSLRVHIYQAHTRRLIEKSHRSDSKSPSHHNRTFEFS